MIITQEDIPAAEDIQPAELAPYQTGKLQYLALLATQPGAMEVFIQLGALAYPTEESHN